jgi:hypothetical protein
MVVLFAGADLAFVTLGFVAFLVGDFFAIVPTANAGRPSNEEDNAHDMLPKCLRGG